MVEIAAAAGLSVETVRKIEHGRIPTPAFFTVAAIADALGASLDALALRATSEAGEPRQARETESADVTSDMSDIVLTPALVRQSRAATRRLSA